MLIFFYFFWKNAYIEKFFFLVFARISSYVKLEDTYGAVLEAERFHTLANRKVNQMAAPDASKMMPKGYGDLSDKEEAEFAALIKDPKMAAAWKPAEKAGLAWAKRVSK